MHDAMRKASDNLKREASLDVHLREFTRSTLEIVVTWKNLKFDWPEIHRSIKDPDCFRFGIWSQDRLSAVALATTTNQAVCLRFVEGDESDDAPLRGLRILIALEAITIYGQLRGKSELKLEPINEKLISLYEDTYGFEAISPRKGSPKYWRKSI